MPELGPEVVSEEGLRDLLVIGYQAVVVCLETPSWKQRVWYGLWVIRCVSLDGKSDRILVTVRRSKDDGDKPRTFRTVNGVFNFLHTLGFRTITIPMEQGGSVAHNLAHHGATQA